MSKIAFVTSPDSFWGAEEAGLETSIVADPSSLAGEIRRLASQGYTLIIVTEDLVADRGEESRAAVKAESPGASLLIVPGPGRRRNAHMELLRERFSIALGIDVWKGAAAKAGEDF